ncbi:ubiquinol oxidase subunit II [Brevibacillus fulvus]|uniref:Quinol oxidase subunit 2 n=1 Tax=Brevibacillus fulvus TaxID=1125967 RepID=A0A938Y0R2_9BACL|nr:COX aromatic rich motif-containing protein [Brevibacillus fulvus]MBM7590324.1 cytochrome aa3-600 menaquinol oxidase subunit 2 [Brevibacillus fulvus]
MKQRGLFNRFTFFCLAVISTILLAGCDAQYFVLDPKGPVAETQYRLIILSVILCTIVIIPVLAILIYIVWRYRDKPDNKAPYMPDWDDSKVLEIVWWGIPIVIIGILGYFTVRDTYALAKPPVSDAKPITIQVTSLDWKWLFQYPDQNIATVNYVEIPTGVPINFQLTSDAPMNSFWIPQLGGQEYTMPGMAMQLWLQADQPGEYYGTGANFSGRDFAHMRFQVVAKPQSEFNEWVDQVKQTAPSMSKADYDKLAEPGQSEEMTFSSFPADLFDEVVNKNGGQYMEHHQMGDDSKDTESDSDGMDHEMMDHEHMNHDMSGQKAE